MKTEKPLSLEQMQNIVHLIIQIGVEAEKRGTITPEEKDAIISFTSTATALRYTYDEFLEKELDLHLKKRGWNEVNPE